MLKTTDWLNALKHKTKIVSDYGIAKFLELTPQRISHYKHERDYFGLKQPQKWQMN
jgi:hypothetical protein